MDRRKFIASVGTVGTVAIAGCTGGNGGNGGNGGEEEEAQTPTHQIGDTFSVEFDNGVIEHTVISAETYENIGGDRQEEPDEGGVFLVVEMELTNQSDESFRVVNRIYDMLDSNDDLFFTDSSAGLSLEGDDRINTSEITGNELEPGDSSDEALVFDVPEGEEMRLQIEPQDTHSPDIHIVELGST